MGSSFAFLFRPSRVVLPEVDLLQLLLLLSNHSRNAFNFNNSDSSSSCRIESREDSQSIWASVLATKLIPTLKQCWIKYPKMIIITSTDKDQPRMMMTGKKKNQFPVFRRRLSHVNSNCYISSLSFFNISLLSSAAIQWRWFMLIHGAFTRGL